jgi:Insertion element 4 transposase N-terminal
LTRIIPFEKVDAVLAERGAAQRLRRLPARVTVYVLLAAALFRDYGYLGVWSRLTVGLSGLAVARVTATALWHARARLGASPLQSLFDLLRRPALAPRTGATCFAGMLVVAIDTTRRALGNAGRFPDSSLPVRPNSATFSFVSGRSSPNPSIAVRREPARAAAGAYHGRPPARPPCRTDP